MSWISALPTVLVCAGLFFVPGLLATYLSGLRGITAWATAPLVTVALVALVAVLGGLFDFRFGVWPVVGATVVVAGLAAAWAQLLRARGVKPPPRDPARYSVAVVTGAIAAAVIGSVTFITGIPRPDAISQTWDAIFHYNAIRYIEQTGKASPLTIGGLGQPGATAGFYPDAWHTMAVLLAELTGAAIPVAAMVTCLVIAVLIWPLSCLLLARHLFGAVGNRAAAAVVITGMLSSLFGGFPWLMTGWGVLWPNALGIALAPVGVALGMSITRISDGDTFGAHRWLYGLAAVWAIGIAHPNSALSVALICVFPLLIAIGPYVADQWSRYTLRTTLVLLAIVVVAFIGILVVFRLPAVRAAVEQFWAPFQTPSQAALSALSNSTDGQAAEWLLAAFLIIGVVACFVWRQRRWLVCAELVIAALYVGSAADGSHVARLFTGLWYDDSHRFAATLPIVAIPLTTMGVLAAGQWLQQALRRMRFAAAIVARPVALAIALPVMIGAVVAGVTAGQGVPGNASTLGNGYSTAGDEALVSPAKLQFMQTVARLVPASALVADNPTGGTAYLFALSGTRVLYPQMSPASNNADMTYLAHNLAQLGQNARTCDLVRRYGVGYLVVAPEHYINSWAQGFYSGVADPRAAGFRLIASAADGQLRLYKITICQPKHGGPVEAATGVAGDHGPHPPHC